MSSTNYELEKQKLISEFEDKYPDLLSFINSDFTYLQPSAPLTSFSISSESTGEWNG